MASPIVIRKYEKADTGDVRHLLQQLGYAHSSTEIKHNIQKLEEQGGLVFIAQLDGKIVGCICAVLDARLAEGLYGELVSLIVSEEHRGHGIGKQLVVQAENWLKGKTDKIRVRANTVRVRAHGFYESLGYSRTKEQKILTKRF